MVEEEKVGVLLVIVVKEMGGEVSVVEEKDEGEVPLNFELLPYYKQY